MSKTDILEILIALSEGEMHGYGIVQAVQANTNGKVSLAPSLLYRRLHRLVQDRLVEDAGEVRGERGKPRRIYRLTGTGRRVLREEAARLVELTMRLRSLRTLDSGEPETN